MMPNLERTLLPKLRDRSETVERELPPGLLSEYPLMVGQVFGNPKVPAVNNVFITINPVDISGTEVEGGAGIITVNGSRSLLAYLVGSKPVVAGDYVICRFVGNRWVAERLGKTVNGISLPGCPCSQIPTSLTMTSSKPTSNNQIFQNATIAYQPTPASLAALKLGSQCYLSTRQFTDTSTNNLFWYYFGCYQGFYIITRVYAVSAFGSPYRDQVRYRWLGGTIGNSCTPFLLSRGTIFSGGDASCVVTISA